MAEKKTRGGYKQIKELGLGGVVTTKRIQTEDPGFVSAVSVFSHDLVQRAKAIASKRGISYEEVLDEWRQAIP